MCPSAEQRAADGEGTGHGLGGVESAQVTKGGDRKLQLRLQAGSYRTEWRGAGCERKLGELVVDEEGEWWLQVLCKTCSRRQGRRVVHHLPVDKRRMTG